MTHVKRNRLVYTVKDRCRVCYTCVRECPVKAIKIINGQAEVIGERCIACGNCVNVCSQGAKAFVEMKDEVTQLLLSNDKVIAAVAPSFPAEFTEIEDHRIFVGMLKKLGFYRVIEVSFGADMVAIEYKKLLEKGHDEGFISSDCPAVVAYVEQHHPNLIEHLAPIVSPMVAIARIIRKMHGDQVKIVFIGPCVAKKGESTEIDEAITFVELRDIFNHSGINLMAVTPMDFDPPHAAKGAGFPISHGLLNTMGRSSDVTDCSVIVTDGKDNFKDAIKEFEKGNLIGKHLELLCCEGCIMGPGMSKGGSRFRRRSIVSRYVADKLENLDVAEWTEQVNAFSNLNYAREFYAAEQVLKIPEESEIKRVLLSLGKQKAGDHLNCGACGYPTCREHAIAILNGLAETEMCLPFTIEKMHTTINDLNESNEKLANARQALRHSEKLANMGQLSAGIAHELNNPLGVITMYSNILKEEVSQDDPMAKDLALIAEQADRCKNIVGGLLNFARKSQVNLQETNIVEFCKHSLDSVIKPSNVEIKFSSNVADPMTMIDQDQFMQVLTNLEKNAVEAMPEGGELSLEVEDSLHDIKITISDTGSGIAPENMEKIFTPFFTTKPIGKGTGMGLPLVYGIVKMHKGDIKVKSENNPEVGPTGTRFKIVLPRKPLN
ncbi:MAG: 4Fe-4S dicluster domain-containing protein [Bacteroidales bacterium]|nr:4Fe-4S dicluster domain-containing protein [Bacteroidales bacterium]